MEIENITALRVDISGGEKAAVTQLRIERLEALGTRHSPASPPASLILPIVLSASLPPPVSSLLDTPLYHFHLASCSSGLQFQFTLYRRPTGRRITWVPFFKIELCICSKAVIFPRLSFCLGLWFLNAKVAVLQELYVIYASVCLFVISKFKLSINLLNAYQPIRTRFETEWPIRWQ